MNSASVYLLIHCLNLTQLPILPLCDKILHIHYLYLTHLISFIHSICLSCSPIALVEYSQVIQQHPLEHLLEKLVQPLWSHHSSQPPCPYSL